MNAVTRQTVSCAVVSSPCKMTRADHSGTDERRIRARIRRGNLRLLSSWPASVSRERVKRKMSDRLLWRLVLCFPSPYRLVLPVARPTFFHGCCGIPCKVFRPTPSQLVKATSRGRMCRPPRARAAGPCRSAAHFWIRRGPQTSWR